LRRQEALAAGLGFAVRVDHPGTPLADYHTTQTPSQASVRRRARAGKSVHTRADELVCDDLKTILSRREYRVGGLFTLCVWRKAEDDPTVETIRERLEYPLLTPYAGRKANALMLPMRPCLLNSESLEAALAAYDDGQPAIVRGLWRQLGAEWSAERPVFADRDAPTAWREARIDQRHDVPLGRDKWRFELRTRCS
jgi:hypothetical protein